MNEIHLHQPIWLGDRSNPCVGIARFRLLKDGKPRRGSIRIWIDYKVTDHLTGQPTLAYAYPFSISCADALQYPTQTLTDFRRTVLHIIPISKLQVVKTRRKRTMPQDEFKNIIKEANNV